MQLNLHGVVVKDKTVRQVFGVETLGRHINKEQSFLCHQGKDKMIVEDISVSARTIELINNLKIYYQSLAAKSEK